MTASTPSGPASTTLCHGFGVVALQHDEIGGPPGREQAQVVVQGGDAGVAGRHHLDQLAVGQGPSLLGEDTACDLELRQQALAPRRQPVRSEPQLHPGGQGGGHVGGLAVEAEVALG
jgi:hypothetical protein